MRQEEFPIQENNVRRLVKAISKEQTAEKRQTGRYVYVNLSMVRLQIMWILPKLIYARGVADAVGAEVCVLTWRPNAMLRELAQALGMKLVSLDEICKRSPVSLLRAIWKTAGIIVWKSKGEELQQVQIWDLPVGRALYEDIIRTSDLSTIRSCRNRMCVKKISHLLWMLYSLKKYIKVHHPVVCISDDIAYHEAIQNALFYQAGAKVYNQHLISEKEVRFDPQNKTIRWGAVKNEEIHKLISETDDHVLKDAEELLDRRFAGKNGRELDRGAFAGKKVYDRDAFIELLGIDPSKKNIVVMAHTFTDAVFNYGDLFYRDYYDWMEQTLKLAGRNKEVNWIIKPHPTRSAYNEEKDSIEKMYEKYKKDHIYLLTDDVSAESIRYIADVIVTIGGNAGAEFACCGIPAVIIGKPYYKGFGFTIEPESRIEYEETLMNIAKINKIEDEQIRVAKKVFYIGMKIGDMGYTFTDKLAMIVRNKDKEMSEKIAVQLFQSNQGTQKYNDEVAGELIDYFNKYEMEKCEYYERGYLRGSKEIDEKRG